MQSYIVNGGEKVEGEIKSSGSKNSSLPILAATILNKGTTVLKNVPDIHDTKIMFDIMRLLGCKINQEKNKIIIDSSSIDNYEIPDELMRQMRSSVILAGAILSRVKKATFSYPGGCDIGARPIDLHLKAFKDLGITIKEENGEIFCDSSNMVAGTITLDFPSIDNYEIPDELMRQMRSSVILAGAILSRVKKATFSYPGGCDIGARPIDLHLKAFKDLGITIKEENGEIFCDSSNMVAGTITLDFPSVGATENIILAAALSNKVIYIKNAAMEPEIVDLQNYINKLGGSVSGAGTKDIKIVGVEKLEANIEYEIMPDRIEIGTLLCAAAITNGNITIKNVRIEHIIPIVYKLEEMGCEINLKEKEINLIANNRLKSCNLKTMPYPGFPTDMQPIIASCLGVAKGTSIIVENIFENRYKYLSELKRMGTRVTIEGRTAIIKGIKRYNAAKVEATDLRGGASLVLAALNAKGKTVISNIGYILRGYENIDEKLRRLGANIYVGEGEIIEKEKK